MRTKVSTYKGFDIFFNDTDNVFQTESESWSQGSKSFTAIKKKINDFIKENDVFGEFKIIGFPNEYHASQKGLITVKGIHANNNFLCEDCNGDRFQLSTSSNYDMRQYCFPEELEQSDYNPKKVKEYEDKIKEYRLKIEKEESKLPESVERRLKELVKEKQELKP